METKGRIYIFRPNDQPRDLAGVAYAVDGEELTFHISSSLEWFRQDMGLTSPRKHDVYAAKYPQGYELIEVIGKQAMQAQITAGNIEGLTYD